MLLYAGARSVGRAFRHRVSGAYELRKRVRPDGAALFLHRPSGVRELPQAGSPFPGGKVFAEPQRGIRRLRTAGASRHPPRGRRRTHGGGQKGRTTCGFPSSLNSYLSLRGHGGNRRTATVSKKGERQRIFSTVGEHSVLPCRNRFAVSDNVLLHMWFYLRRRGITVPRNSWARYHARHLRIRRLVQFIFTGPVYYNTLTNCAALLCRT